MLKWILIGSFILNKAYEGYLKYLDNSYLEKEPPENVRDVYDKEEYKKWLSYEKEGGRVDLINDIVDSALVLIILIFNIHSFVFSLFAGFNIYLQYLFTLAVFTVISMIVSVPFDHYDTFVIEEKYGMNKTTKKTFVLDVIKEAVLSLIVSYGLLMLIMFLFERFGNRGIILAILAVIALSIVISLIVMPIMRIFNKFEPLEDGELKDGLLALCEKYGIRVKKICVKDASRRTTKANAFCTGLTKKKTISLDDNLVNDYTTDQIIAVFAHEFAHARYNHQIKTLPFAFLRTVISVAALGILVNFSEPFTAFGFSDVNYYFAFLLISLISWPVSTVFDLISNHISRKHEYQADGFAAKEGYGIALIEALKKLSKDSLTDLNPHPLVVKMLYSHPTLSQRIDAIEKIETEAANGN